MITPLFGLRPARAHLRGEAAVAHARVDDALVAGGDESIERHSAHVGVSVDDVDAGSASRSRDVELGVAVCCEYRRV